MFVYSEELCDTDINSIDKINENLIKSSTDKQGNSCSKKHFFNTHGKVIKTQETNY